jgi:hypothetical protein
VTSLSDIPLAGGHVISCHGDETIWPLWVERPWESVRDESAGGMRVMRCEGDNITRPLKVGRALRGEHVP